MNSTNMYSWEIVSVSTFESFSRIAYKRNWSERIQSNYRVNLSRYLKTYGNSTVGSKISKRAPCFSQSSTEGESMNSIAGSELK